MPNSQTKANDKIDNYVADPGEHIGHVHLKVADLERSLAFCRRACNVMQRLRFRSIPRRRVSPPYRHQHVGEPGWLPASTRIDRALPHGHRLPNSGFACRCAAQSITGAITA